MFPFLSSVCGVNSANVETPPQASRIVRKLHNPVRIYRLSRPEGRITLYLGRSSGKILARKSKRGRTIAGFCQVTPAVPRDRAKVQQERRWPVPRLGQSLDISLVRPG